MRQPLSDTERLTSYGNGLRESRARRANHSRARHISAIQPACLLPARLLSLLPTRYRSFSRVLGTAAGASAGANPNNQQPTAKQPNRCGATSWLERSPRHPTLVVLLLPPPLTSYLDLYCNRFRCRGCRWWYLRIKKRFAALLPLFRQQQQTKPTDPSSTFTTRTHKTTTHHLSLGIRLHCLPGSTLHAPLPHPITTSVTPRFLQPTDEAFGTASRLLQPVDAGRCFAIVG